MTDKCKTSIFQSNHIDDSLEKDKIEELKALYRFYHRKFICYKLLFKYFKKLDLICNKISVILITSGVVVGSVTLNPIVLGTISSSGVILKTYAEAKNYSETNSTGATQHFLSQSQD